NRPGSLALSDGAPAAARGARLDACGVHPEMGRVGAAHLIFVAGAGCAETVVAVGDDADIDAPGGSETPETPRGFHAEHGIAVDVVQGRRDLRAQRLRAG